LDEFESLLELVQGEDNFSINVVDKAYNSLCRMTRDALFQNGYHPPVFANLTSRQEQFEALATLHQRAINEEEKIMIMCKIAADNNSSSSSHSNSSYHIPVYKMTIEDATSEDYLSAVVDAANHVLIAMTDGDHLQLQAVQDIYDSDPTFHMLVNSFANSLSPAKNALHKSSGLDRPKDCFGCEQPDHNFQNCPSRDNPDAIARAAMKFAIMRGNKTFAEHPTISKWQEIGFTSKEAATKAILIADPKTNKANLSQALIKSVYFFIY
jgi:hypothetical protein